MLTGTIRIKIHRIWNAFWSGAVSKSLSVIESLTFLSFIKRSVEPHNLYLVARRFGDIFFR